MAAGLPARWQGRGDCTVLDLDFADPTPFVATLHAWRTDPCRCGRLRYAALLERPLDRGQALGRLRRAGLDGEDLREIGSAWPPPLAGVHRIELAAGRVQITLAIGPARTLLPGWVPHADALFVRTHGDRDPDAGVLRAAAHRLVEGARIALDPPGAGPDSAIRHRRLEAVLATLASAGFAPVPVDAAGDRDSPPACLERRHGRATPRSGPGDRPRDAMVIGAGLAGSAVAHALARRGWTVQRLDTDDGVVPRGSLQPVLAQHPSVTPDDAPLSRLLRTATLLARGPFDTAGVLRRHGRVQCIDPAAAGAAVGRLPRDWVETVDAREASERAGVPLRSGGLWLPLACSADPLELRAAWAGPGVMARTGPRIAVLRAAGEGWQALDPAGRVIAEASLAIVAGGASDLEVVGRDDRRGAPLWARFGDAGLQRRGGRTTLASVSADRLPRCIVGGDGHAIAIDADRLLLGPAGAADGDPATAALPAPILSERAWRRWSAMLEAPDMPIDLVPGPVGLRLSTRDHLPLAGPVPRTRDAAGVPSDRIRADAEPGLWVATALGGRGLLWAVLAAESIASALEGEPLPVEVRLAGLLSPARFLGREARPAAGTVPDAGSDARTRSVRARPETAPGDTPG